MKDYVVKKTLRLEGSSIPESIDTKFFDTEIAAYEWCVPAAHTTYVVFEILQRGKGNFY